MAIIGIDLGTSNSAAAVLRGSRPVLIPSAEGVTLGGKAFPSYVAITADGQVLIAQSAPHANLRVPTFGGQSYERSSPVRFEVMRDAIALSHWRCDARQRCGGGD
jgi:molecular chaperone DnaK